MIILGIFKKHFYKSESKIINFIILHTHTHTRARARAHARTHAHTHTHDFITYNTHLILSYLILYLLRLVRNIRYLFLIYCRTKIITELNFHSRSTTKKRKKKTEKKNYEKHRSKYHDFRHFSPFVSWQS